MKRRCPALALAVALCWGCSNEEGSKEILDGRPPDLVATWDSISKLPDGYGPLYSCKDPGKSCNAHDLCAVNAICGPDLKCWPTFLMDCNDELECTVDTCLGQGLCSNTPKLGTCALPVRVGGTADGGSADGGNADGGGADSGAAPDAGAGTTVIKCFKTGDRSPNDSCLVCDSSSGSDGGSASNSSRWMQANSGSCDDGNSCTKDDTCTSGVCKGTSYLSQCADDYACTDDLCDGKGGCLGSALKSDWCLINGTCYKNGAKHPSGTCFECDVSQSQAGWSALKDTCLIGSVCYKKGDKNSGGCAECDPATSATSWTVSGTTHCLIGSTCVASGTTDSTGCGKCDPTKDKYAYSPLSGLCQIAGACYPDGTKHPKGCAECKVTTSQTQWTLTSTTDCLISNECYTANTLYGCNKCDPTVSQTAWTPVSGCANVAPQATATSTGGGSSTMGPDHMNNGKLEADCDFHWVTATSTPSTKYIQYTWASAVTVSGVSFDTTKASTGSCSLSAGRSLAGGTLQYDSGGAWVDIGTISSQTDDWSYNFAQVTTTKLRLYGVHATDLTGQKSNPVIFEWQVFGK